MKKIVLFSIIAVLLITGCSDRKNPAEPAVKPAAEAASHNTPPPGVDLIIGDKLFIGQVNDVYRNRNDYLGKTIRIEGMFMSAESGGKEYCYVFRKGPGCCGDDGQVGFEVYWNPPDSDQVPGNAKKAYPKRNDWVEAQGELKRYSENGANYLYLALSYLEVMEERGVEFVTQ